MRRLSAMRTPSLTPASGRVDIEFSSPDECAVTYFPRRSPLALFRQYFNQGHGRAFNFLKHRKNAKLRHLVLVGIAPIVSLLMLAPFSPIFAVPFLSWGLLCLGYGMLLGLRLRDPCAAAAGIAAMATQAGWSFGFFAGLMRALTGTASGGSSAKPIAVSTPITPE